MLLVVIQNYKTIQHVTRNAVNSTRPADEADRILQKNMESA